MARADWLKSDELQKTKNELNAFHLREGEHENGAALQRRVTVGTSANPSGTAETYAKTALQPSRWETRKLS